MIKMCLTSHVSECTLTYMMTKKIHSRSTAEARRIEVLPQALCVFAQTGYYATTVTDVANATGISQGYVMRLFGTKLELFVAVVDYCYEQIADTLTTAAKHASTNEALDVLDSMSNAYAELIADRDLLRVQVHAQSVTNVDEVREAVQRGLQRVVTCVRTHARANDDQLQRFIAYGQLCNLIITAELESIDSDWAKSLTIGFYHPSSSERR